MGQFIPPKTDFEHALHVIPPTHFRTRQTYRQNILEKWFPLQGERCHSSYFRCFQKHDREEGETE